MYSWCIYFRVVYFPVYMLHMACLLPLPRPDFAEPAAKICESQSMLCRSASMLFQTGHHHGRGTDQL